VGRAADLMNKYQGTHTLGGGQGEQQIEQGDWRKTGVHSGLPQIRRRPHYPHFDEVAPVGTVEDGRSLEDRAGQEEGDRSCQKFYSTYKKQKQTGGLMVLWCRHSRCLAFHVIPRAEGRNDVFSQIFTRWPKAPRWIIYDFACSLGPYSLAREAEYFKQTTFLIDRFHCSDHTACSTSCFVDRYMGHSTKLLRVNTSAAECGNAALGRIRKSLSYCSQSRAVALAYHFFNIWNRVRA
jgi:hypothetical protein